MPINKRYDIKLEVLTPLSVGSGVERDYVRGVDYVQKNGRVYLLNLRKMAENGLDINQFTSYIANQDANSISRLIGNKLEVVSDRVFVSPVSSNNPIKAMTKNEFTHCPIIPGSSIKGSLRSHIFTCLGGDETTEDKDLFGDMNRGENFMRFIKLSDFEFEDTQLVNTKIFNLRGNNDEWQGGWKHGANRTTLSFNAEGFNTIYESIMPSASACGCIMVSDLMFDKTFNYHGKSKQRDLLDIHRLFIAINKHAKSYLLKERHFFETYNQADGVDDIIDSIDELLHLIPDNGNACVIKMAAGVGFHAITGDWQFDDYTGGNLNRKWKDNPYADSAKPKSRKIAIFEHKKTLMGFVKISLVDADSDDVLLHQQKWNTNVNDVITQSLQKVEEVRNKKKAEEESKKQRLKYETLVSKAEQLVQDGVWNAAEKLLLEAGKIQDDGKHVALLEDIRGAISKKNEEEAKRLEKEADCEYAQAHYKAALERYEKIASLNVAVSVYNKIEVCKQMLNSASETIEQFAERLVVASLAAFAGNCKKRIEAGHTFTTDDMSVLAHRIKSASLSKKQMREWEDRKKWEKTKLFDYLGKEAALRLYENINSK